MTINTANLAYLDPRLYPLAETWLEKCSFYFKTRITVTYRGPIDQSECKAEGLSNAAAGESPHNCVDDKGEPSSRAWDFAIFNDDGSYVTDGTDPRYTLAGHIAEDMGLAWGGRWNHPDYDHIEMKDWKTT